MNPAAPKILNEMVESLKTAKLIAVTEDDEGRVNSKKDEANVIKWLMEQPQFHGRVREVGLRQFGDMIVTDYDGQDHYVNIKTSAGSSDNAFSKLGFLYAYTDIPVEDMPSSISDKKWFELMMAHKKDIGRDYWYLMLDKSNMNNVMVRGVKQIQNWVYNPTNNLQVNWKKECTCSPKETSFDQSFKDVVVNGVLYCWEKKVQSMLDGIEYRKRHGTA
jgi:hypothetical protein